MTIKINRFFFKKYYLECIVFLLAILLRYIGIIPGYPAMHPDEPVSYGNAIKMLENSYNPGRFDYPAGMAFISAVTYRTIFLPIQMTRLFISQPDMIVSYLKLDKQMIQRSYGFLFGPRWIYAMYWTRFIHATFGWLTVVILYLIAKRLFNRTTALTSAAFLAVNHRHVLGSHIGVPDVLNGFFALLAFVAAVLLIEKRTLRRYVFVGITAGLSFSIKYQPFAFLPLLFSHVYWAVKEKKITNLFHPYAWVALLVALITFTAINPYYFFNIQDAFVRNSQDIVTYEMGIIKLRPYGFFYLFHWGIGRLASIAVLLGAVLMLVARPKTFLLIASFGLTFVVFMTIFSNGAKFPRNFVTAMPLLMLFAGFGMGKLYEALIRLRIPTAGVFVVIVVLVINSAPFLSSWNLVSNWSKPHNSGMLAKWLEQRMPPTSTVRAYPLFLAAAGADIFKKKHIMIRDWDYTNGPGPNSLAEFQESGDDFAILQSMFFQTVTYRWREFPKLSWALEYQDVPYDYITNRFLGLTLRELLPYTVGEVYKPIQENEINYLVFKIPKRPRSRGEPIIQFFFDTPQQLIWESIDPYSLGKLPVRWDRQGNLGSGSLLIEKGGDETSRVSSPSFPVIPGKQYLISGFLKEESGETDIHEGYLRMDFYKNKEDYKIEAMSLGVALSSRVLPNAGWIRKEFAATAPFGANFATISFQRFSQQFKISAVTNNVLDDIEVFEADTTMPEPYQEVPYIRSTIRWSDIFHASFL